MRPILCLRPATGGPTSLSDEESTLRYVITEVLKRARGEEDWWTADRRDAAWQPLSAAAAGTRSNHHERRTRWLALAAAAAVVSLGWPVRLDEFRPHEPRLPPSGAYEDVALASVTPAQPRSEHRPTARAAPPSRPAESREDGPSEQGLELQGVILGITGDFAVINGAIVTTGQRIRGATVVRIEPDRVRLRAGGNTLTLPLRPGK